jgi:hypothetical protein
MKKLAILTIAFLVITTAAFSQPSRTSQQAPAPEPLTKRQTALEAESQAKNPAATKPKPDDSVEFAKTFKEFYPLVKPKESIKKQAEDYFSRISRSFASQGIDSVEARKTAFKNLDSAADEKIYFETYRKNLTAKELKAYMSFLKSPEGKHIVEIMPNLQRAPSESQGYVSRTMNTNLAPIRQKSAEKMKDEIMKQDTSKMDPATKARWKMMKDQEKKMHERDSIMKARGLGVPSGGK